MRERPEQLKRGGEANQPSADHQSILTFCVLHRLPLFPPRFNRVIPYSPAPPNVQLAPPWFRFSLK
jgi:hypothetical protein